MRKLVGNTDVLSGVSLFSGSEGGYVIVGLASFLLGSITTVLIKLYTMKKDRPVTTEIEKHDRPDFIADESLFIVAGGKKEDKPSEDYEQKEEKDK